MSGATSAASGFGSRMSHWPRSSGAPKFQLRMIKALPRPAIAGSASCAPAAASFFIRGNGLISLFSGMKPDTMTPGPMASGNAPRRDRLRRGLPDVGRQGIAPCDGVAAKFGLHCIDG